MPVVLVNKSRILQKIGIGNITDEEFDKICFDFGIELDDVLSSEELSAQETNKCREKGVYYKIEVPANRYDLLCIEGMAYALSVFLGLRKQINLKVDIPKDTTPVSIIVEESVAKIRPVLVSAVIKGVSFDKYSFESLIELQEKLHFNICRKRSLVSIGVHDLDSLKPPLRYRAINPDQISFVALNECKEMSITQLFREYKQRSVCSVKQYLSIIEDFGTVPVILDSDGVVCSVPPIINGEHSKITLDTKNLLLEVTATDKTKAEIVLNTLCFAISHYSLCRIQAVHISDQTSDSITVTPAFSMHTMTIKPEYISKRIGVDLTAEQICRLLGKMQLKATVLNNEICVSIPVTRPDILHPCDVLEDVAISYGYDNIPSKVPETYTVGGQLPLNKLSDKIRSVVAQSGFSEVLNWILTSADDNYKKLLRAEDEGCVKLSSSRTKELSICRTTLFPGVLKAVVNNLGKISIPIKVFEVGDVVDCLDENEARNQRWLCAVYLGRSTECFEILNGLLDQFMASFGLIFRDNNSNPSTKASLYHLEESSFPHLFPGRQAHVIVQTFDGWKGVVGSLGIVHPEVCGNFSESINSSGFLVSVLEINIQLLFEQNAMRI